MIKITILKNQENKKEPPFITADCNQDLPDSLTFLFSLLFVV